MPKKTLGFCAALAVPAPTHAATCPAGYYLENGACQTCTSGNYCPGDDLAHMCPDTETDSAYCYIGENTLVSEPGAAAPTQCYLDRNISDFWIYEYRYPGFYRVNDAQTGKCYYSYDANIYSDCNAPKRFSECFVGYFIDNNTQQTAEFINSCTPCPIGTYMDADFRITLPTGVKYYVQEQHSPNPFTCAVCPDGTSTHAPGTTSGDQCTPLCPTGVTHIRVGTATVPLWPGRTTSPSLAVQTPGGICYADLINGTGPGINITIAGTPYHTP